MSKVLVLKASPLSDEMSVSKRLLRHFLETYKDNNKEDEIKIIDVNQVHDIGLTHNILTENLEVKDYEIIANRRELLHDFKDADKIIIASPMWNYGIPAPLKAVLDTFPVAKDTFRYLDKPNAEGAIVEGLTTGKKMLFIQSMGGYNKGKDDISFKQVRAIFQLVGVSDISYVACQATNIPGTNEMEQAKASLTALAKTF